MRNTKNINGFTVAELLIAMAIMAIILSATAVAFNAAVVNYRENQDLFNSVNTARQAMDRITAQLRTADAVEPNSPANECTLLAADGSDVTYQYNSDDNKLYLVTNDDLSDSDYVLCDNVSAMSFTKNTATEDSITYVKSVQITMTVVNGRVQQTVAAAAVVRKNLN